MPTMSEIPTFEPATIAAGDTAKWRRELPDYPASAGWTLTYTLVRAAQRITFTASADGDLHLVNVAASTTTGWAAGSYTWRAQVSKAGEVYTVGTGTVLIRANFTTATDGRSHARKVLDAIEAVIEGRASSEVSYYMIGGRQLRYMEPSELMGLRDRYRAEVAREEAAERVSRGLPDQRRVYVRFAAGR
jgi:hypothetical protein